MAVQAVTVFTRNDCQACKGTEALFTSLKVPFAEINVEREGNEHYAQQLVDEGFRAMPVVHVTFDDESETWWSGSKPKAIRAVADGRHPDTDS
jgi:glutaredoxin